MYKKLYIGTGGIPLTTISPGLLTGIRRIHELGLDAMEIEWVHGVHGNFNLFQAAGTLTQKLGVELTAHGSYYINLDSREDEKRVASIKRILDAARAASACGARSLTFHAAFYQGRDKNLVYETVKAQLTDLVRALREEKNNVVIRPELTGKVTQFGDLDELIALAQEVKGVLPCIDFSHYCARYAGRANSYQAFCEVLERLKRGLGKEILNNMHMHVSGIEFTARGERRHLPLDQSEFNYQALMQALTDYEVKGVLICESPLLEGDALLLKKQLISSQ